MKKIFILLFLCSVFLFPQSTLAIENIVSLDDVHDKQIETLNSEKQLDAEISFDWLDISLAQREENVAKYKNLLFNKNSSNIYFDKDEFKTEFRNYRKDKEYKLHYMLTNEGVTEDEEAKYCAFYFKRNTLMMYAIQYKDNPHRAFYYSAFGKLYFTDVISDEYPNFPYTSMQYNHKGQLKSAIYFVSKDIQYMFDGEQEFQGIWYKDKMYNKSGKQVLTRSNW